MMHNSIDSKNTKSSTRKQNKPITSRQLTINKKQCQSFTNAVADVILAFIQKRNGKAKKSTLYKYLNETRPSKFTRPELKAGLDFLLNKQLINCVQKGLGWIIYLNSPRN